VLLTFKAGPFVIDLAVLASRREYLNLDKWLTDQVSGFVGKLRTSLKQWPFE
jgi:hypothetical protein